MSHIRTIKPDFFFDEEITSLPDADQLFFIGLWCEADKEGRLEDRPKVLRAKIKPHNAKFDAEATLKRLHPKFIYRYQVDGKRYLQINNFAKHQKPHHTEKDSVIPQPERREYEVNEPLAHGELTNEKNSLEEGREGKGREGSASSGEPEAAAAPPELTEVLSKLTAVKLDRPGELWRAWKQAYPAVDIPREILKAEAWAIGKNVKRSPKGWSKTLNGWLSRVQDEVKPLATANGKREVVI